MKRGNRGWWCLCWVQVAAVGNGLVGGRALERLASGGGTGEWAAKCWIGGSDAEEGEALTRRPGGEASRAVEGQGIGQTGGRRISPPFGAALT